MKGEAEKITLEDSERTACEVWTRVMGYHRPTSYFNIGKRGEHEERKHFEEKTTVESAGKVTKVLCAAFIILCAAFIILCAACAEGMRSSAENSDVERSPVYRRTLTLSRSHENLAAIAEGRCGEDDTASADNESDEDYDAETISPMLRPRDRRIELSATARNRGSSNITASHDSFNAATAQVNTSTPDLYIPQAVSLENIMRRESKVCFLVARWILQPLDVISPFVTMICTGVSEFYIESDPKTARLATALGLGFAAIDFVCSVLTIKVNDKLQKNDAYLQRDNGNNAGAQAG